MGASAVEDEAAGGKSTVLKADVGIMGVDQVSVGQWSQGDAPFGMVPASNH